MSADQPHAGLSQPAAWAKLLALYDRGSISSTELQSQLLTHIEGKAPEDFEPVVVALRGHGEEFIRTCLADTIVRLVESGRRVIDYTHEALPLVDWIGCRVHIGGGYTAAYERDQPWLAGRDYHEGTLIDKLKIHDRMFPAAVVKLDYLLDLSQFEPVLRGQFLLLVPRYRDHSWAASEGIAFAYLMETVPKNAAWWADAAIRDRIARVIPLYPAGAE